MVPETPVTVTLYVPAEVPLLGFDAQALSKIIDTRTSASGIASAKALRRFCKTNVSNNIARSNQIGTCRRILVEGRQLFANGGTEPCWVVKTLMVALLPCIKELGAAEHVLIGAVVEQLKTTVKEKPSTPVELTAFL